MENGSKKMPGALGALMFPRRCEVRGMVAVGGAREVLTVHQYALQGGGTMQP